MSTSPTEGRMVPDWSTYAKQFQKNLRWIDGQVFRPHREHCQSVLIEKRFSAANVPGHHINRFATLHKSRLLEPSGVARIGKKYVEGYFIWAKEVEHVAEEKIGVGALGERWSDGEMKYFLFGCAMCSVRYRVLAHKELFPLAKLRTLTSAFGEETIPAEHRKKLFAKKRDAATFGSDGYQVDATMLMLLIQFAVEDRAKPKELLHLLTNT